MHNYVPNLEKKILISDLDYGKLQDTSIFYRQSVLYVVISTQILDIIWKWTVSL